MRYVVAQLGARMHYAVPRIFHRAGILERVYTDICGVKGWPRLLRAVPDALRTPAVRRLVGRVPQGIPEEKVTAFTRFGLAYARRRGRVASPESATATYLWAGETFCRLVLRHASFKGVDGVYAFNGAGLELLRHARETGARAVLEQTSAPREYEVQIIEEERRLHPGWENPPTTGREFDKFVRREREEWEAADTILCASEFVKESVGRCGGQMDHCRLVQYGIESAFFTVSRRLPRDSGPLRVLTVGGIKLQKGSPYVLEAARMLKGGARFRMVGPISIRDRALVELRDHVEVTGPVPRTDVLEHYAWADLLLLPSLCEGSATVTYEALSCGLPVICTPNTGSVVRDGEDGFVVPPRDPAAIAERIGLLSSRPDLLEEMSGRASARRDDISVEAYAARILSAVGEDGRAGSVVGGVS